MTSVNNSVLHLTMRFQKIELSIGSGVLYRHGSEYFIVTAWHNLSGLHSETLKPLSDKLAIPDNVVVNLAVSMPGFSIDVRYSITIPLVDDEKSLFYIHSRNWPRIDVAVIPFDPRAAFPLEGHLSNGESPNMLISPIMNEGEAHYTEVCPIQNYFVPDDEVIDSWFKTVDVTEELFIPGYPLNIRDAYSQPVWKRATIASSVQRGWNKEAKFLIDSASKSGMSGAPVLYYSPRGQVSIHGKIHQFDKKVAILVGIYVGRVGIKGELDPQIGTVWHRSVIDEIIESKLHEKLSSEIELTHDEMVDELQNIFAGMSRIGIENIKNKNLRSRYYVRESLMENISGRAKPELALKAVLDAAENYSGELVEDDV